MPDAHPHESSTARWFYEIGFRVNSDAVDLAQLVDGIPGASYVYGWGSLDDPEYEGSPAKIMRLVGALTKAHERASTNRAAYRAMLRQRDELRAAIEEYGLWEPGRKGHAEAHRRLLAAARTEPKGEQANG